MLPGFPPGIFPFWGPFPAVPPPAAPPSAAEAPQSSTEAPQTSGEDMSFTCPNGGVKSSRGFISFCLFISQEPARRPHPAETLLQPPPLRDRRYQAFPSPCLPLLPSPPRRGHRYHRFLPSVSSAAPSLADSRSDVATGTSKTSKRVLFRPVQCRRCPPLPPLCPNCLRRS